VRGEVDWAVSILTTQGKQVSSKKRGLALARLEPDTHNDGGYGVCGIKEGGLAPTFAVWWYFGECPGKDYSSVQAKLYTGHAHKHLNRLVGLVYNMPQPNCSKKTNATTHMFLLSFSTSLVGRH
jgi:hypothetical protein